MEFDEDADPKMGIGLKHHPHRPFDRKQALETPLDDLYTEAFEPREEDRRAAKRAAKGVGKQGVETVPEQSEHLSGLDVKGQGKGADIESFGGPQKWGFLASPSDELTRTWYMNLPFGVPLPAGWEKDKRT